MPSRTYEVGGNTITITDADKNAEEAAIQLVAAINAEKKLREIATHPGALDCMEKYAANGDKLVNASSLLRETLKSQEVVLQFIKNLDPDNAIKSSIPAVKKFRELKTLLDSIAFPEITDTLKKVLPPKMIDGAEKLNSSKAFILETFKTCIKLNSTIESSGREALAKRKANSAKAAAAQVQPVPAANQPSNPAAFMHSNAKSAEAAAKANTGTQIKAADQKPKTT